MDLVDIDQVLDNLELREAADENSKAVVLRAHTDASVELKEHASTSNGLTATETAKATYSASCTSNSNSSSNSYSKSFIGVSQVFNSLDDYRKNVESLESVAEGRRYDEECKLIADAGTARDAFPMRSSTHEEVDHVDDTICNKDDVEVEDDDDEDYEDEDNASNDIQKFIENTGSNRKDYADNEPDDITITSTSESLTTSSSSTFSSGPSPGFVSTTEEHSTPLSPATELDERAEVADASKAQFNIHDEPLPVMAVTGDIQINGHEESVAVAISHATTTTGLDDLAIGLSSISINTANTQSDLPREITISSALGGLLSELSATTQTSLLSRMREDCAEDFHKPLEFGTDSKSSLISPSPLLSSLPEHNSIKEPKVKINCDGAPFVEVAVTPAVAIKEASLDQIPQQFQKPVTFGSTMDEISDTELDSMLQEMDIDDVADEPLKYTTTVANKKSEEKAPANVEQQQHVAETATVAVDMEKVASGIDQMNADSFSQASTVEFSEIKMQQNLQTATNDFANQPMVSPYASSESLLECEISADSKADAYDQSQKRPKRPTTLDLPVKKANLYANAGQTPPGINLPQSDAEFESPEGPVSASEPNDLGVENLQPVVEYDDKENAANNGIHQVESDSMPDTDEDITANAPEADIAEATGYSDPYANLGKIPPIWVPDNMATSCMQCHIKFTMIKRRHHCRACGKVLCSVCCSQKFKLEFLVNPESRVCVQCFLILSHRQQAEVSTTSSLVAGELDAVGRPESPSNAALHTVASASTRSPNPNNPMEYCSTIPPHCQVSSTVANLTPSVIVPVGVLKKDGGSYSSNSSNSSNKMGRKRKSVMFSDGIAPGSDLAIMENQWSEAKHARRHQQGDKQRSGSISNKPQAQARTEYALDANTMGLVAQLFRGSIPPIAAAGAVTATQAAPRNAMTDVGDAKMSGAGTNTVTKGVSTPSRARRLPPSGCDEKGCFIPQGDHCLPPIYITKGDNSCEFDYKDVANTFELVERLQRETLKFALQKNFFVFVKIVNLKCCMNKTVINFTTSGMHQVGNDEIILLLEYELPTNKSDMTEPPIPRDIFVHLNEIYVEAEKCNPIAELSFTMPQQSNFLGSREYGGFLYIRATFQCLQDVIMPESPFLIGVLIHRYEVPWAKVFPLRLMLRLGAQYRYYPCPHISIRDRESVYAEIAQTIINFLADFRNYSYTLPSIKGMYIHMEDRQTSVLIPRNRYDDVIKAINNSSDHILAFGGNFSKTADGHLVCMQNTNDEHSEMFSYSTQAINIQGHPRKVTGASFFVLNEALKSTSGLSGKCSIVEDGLMVQILPSKMDEVRSALKNTKDIDIVCGPLDADEQQTEIVSIKWVENDCDFGIGIISPIDSMSLEGVSGMRVHASFTYASANYSIRLSEIYMIKCDDWNNRMHANDITRISEQIARSTSVALMPFLDLLAANGSFKIGLRVTLHQENVCYEAGTRNTKLPPLYMNALDNHLIPTLHNESTGIDDAIILELIFYILNV